MDYVVLLEFATDSDVDIPKEATDRIVELFDVVAFSGSSIYGTKRITASTVVDAENPEAAGFQATTRCPEVFSVTEVPMSARTLKAELIETNP